MWIIDINFKHTLLAVKQLVITKPQAHFACSHTVLGYKLFTTYSGMPSRAGIAAPLCLKRKGKKFCCKNVLQTKR